MRRIHFQGRRKRGRLGEYNEEEGKERYEENKTLEGGVKKK